MAATTVTGQSGRGIAYGGRGPGNKRNQFVPNVSPHVVAAGTITLTTGTATTQTVSFGDVSNVSGLNNAPLTETGSSGLNLATGSYTVLTQLIGIAPSAATSLTVTKNTVTGVDASNNSWTLLSGLTFTNVPQVAGELEWVVMNTGRGIDSIPGIESNSLVTTSIMTV